MNEKRNIGSDFWIGKAGALLLTRRSKRLRRAGGLKKGKLPFYDFSISKLPKTKDSENSQVGELAKSIAFYLKTINTGAGFKVHGAG